jgi:RNA polymerase subunit RPABC4/transcription elongation factor Spt4
MGTHVVQCLDCKAWNWEGVERCASCGSKNLTIGFHQLIAYLERFDPDFSKELDRFNQVRERR